MISVLIKIGFCLLIAVTCSCTPQSDDQHSPDRFTVLSGPYLGQEPPTDSPVLFAPGIVADIHHEHSSAVFSPDGRELFWTMVVMPLQSPLPAVIMHSELVNGLWTQPEVASFSGNYDDDIGGFSPDGQRLFIASRRPIPGTTTANRKGDIWVVAKTETGWSEPVWLNSPINTEHHESNPTLTRKGKLYFVSRMENVRGDRGIYWSKQEGDSFSTPEPLGPNINSESLDWCPYVDPDEEYIIFSSLREGGFGSGDLYISFMQTDGTFGKAINMGSRINSNDNDRFPSVSPDGKYIFFLSKRTELPDHFEKPVTFDRLTKMSQSITNGLSNIYWVESSIIQKLKATNLK